MAESIQPVYFKDVLTSECNMGYVLHWERGFAFVFCMKTAMDTINMYNDWIQVGETS